MSRAFEGTIGCREVVWPRYSSDVEQLFLLFLPVALIQDSHYLDKIDSGVGLLVTLNTPSVFMQPPSCANYSLIEFFEKIYRKKQGFWRFFVSRFVYLQPNALIFIFWDHAAVKPHYQKVIGFC